MISEIVDYCELLNSLTILLIRCYHSQKSIKKWTFYKDTDVGISVRGLVKANEFKTFRNAIGKWINGILGS